MVDIVPQTKRTGLHARHRRNVGVGGFQINEPKFRRFTAARSSKHETPGIGFAHAQPKHFILFFKQLNIGMGMDPDQNIVLSVKTMFNVDYMDEGVHIFNVVSSDGSLLAIDGALHINSPHSFQKCLS